MKAKLDKLNEMSKLLSTQDRVNGDLLSLFGRFDLDSFCIGSVWKNKGAGIHTHS